MRSSVSDSMMDVAVPVDMDGNDVVDYIVYIADDKQEISDLSWRFFQIVMQAMMFGLLAAILLSFLLSKTMIIPIQRLTEGAMRVAEGDFSRKIEVVSQDEIGVLTDTFNDMAGQLQDTLRQVENERNKLDTLFLHMTDGVVAFSREGKVIHSNPAAAQLLLRRIGPETTYASLFGQVAPLDQVLDTPDHLEGELQVRDSFLQLLLAPFDRGQAGGGVLVVLHDVTEERNNQEMQREFVANVSHELRTPLTNIRSYAETLEEGLGDMTPETARSFLGVILNESDRMTHIVQDLLTLSRFDSGRSELHLARFPFDRAVRDTCQAVLLEAQKHAHTVRLEVPGGMPEVLADQERVMQVMMNIVSNAIKYTPDGGTIVLRAGADGGR